MTLKAEAQEKCAGWKWWHTVWNTVLNKQITQKLLVYCTVQVSLWKRSARETDWPVSELNNTSVWESASASTRSPADLVLDELEVAAPERDPHDGARQLVEHLVHVPVAQSIRNAWPARTGMCNNTGGYNRAQIYYTTSRYPYTTDLLLQRMRWRTGRRADGDATRAAQCPAACRCTLCPADVSRPPRSRSGCAAAVCQPACPHWCAQLSAKRRTVLVHYILCDWLYFLVMYSTVYCIGKANDWVRTQSLGSHCARGPDSRRSLRSTWPNRAETGPTASSYGSRNMYSSDALVHSVLFNASSSLSRSFEQEVKTYLRRANKGELVSLKSTFVNISTATAKEKWANRHEWPMVIECLLPAKQQRAFLARA